MSLSTCTRILRLGSGWSVGQIKGRPFNVQAKGQLWPTRAFYAECAQVRAGRQSRNADFISIAAKRRYHHPLNPLNPLNLLNLFLHNPSTQPAVPAASLFLSVASAAIVTLGAKGPVKPKNPWAEGPSILRALLPIISFPVIIRKNKYSYFRFISYCLLALDSAIMLLKNI